MAEKYFAQPSVMSAQQHFAQVPSAEIERSKFDRSHAVKTTFDAGKLIPIFVDEVLPGDTFNLRTTAFARLATPLRPVMDNMYLDIHYFFVPNRLVWTEWQQFMGERPTPTFDPNTVLYPAQPWNRPNTAVTSVNVMDSIGCYFGLPPRRYGADTQYENVSCLPFRAYKLIWNEWYRDQNIQNPVALGELAGYDSDTDIDIAPLRRGKRHDYFTSALPWPQKGDPVVIPLGGDLPVFGIKPVGGTGIAYSQFAYESGGVSRAVSVTGDDATIGGVNYATNLAWPDNQSQFLYLHPDRQIGIANLDDATSVSINELRTAFQIQRLLERDARGGTRYIELILSHFGVRSDDARLQRPEYLGGGSTRVNINPIASTATVPDEAPQANLAAVGTVVGNAKFTKSFTEHGWILGFASVRADLTYQQGINRMWSRKTRFEHYWPALSHLGEQAVNRKELYYTGTSATDNAVFGYQERYAEYRYKPSVVTGAMNSAVSGSLDTWHLAQAFGSNPTLSPAFIVDEPPIERIIAVDTEPHFLCDIWHDLKCDRPMPVYSEPGLIDHF